jgi:hypothetical protein
LRVTTDAARVAGVLYGLRKDSTKKQNICCSDRPIINLYMKVLISLIYTELIYYCLHLVGSICSINIYSLELVMGDKLEILILCRPQNMSLCLYLFSG